MVDTVSGDKSLKMKMIYDILKLVKAGENTDSKRRLNPKKSPGLPLWSPCSCCYWRRPPKLCKGPCNSHGTSVGTIFNIIYKDLSLLQKSSRWVLKLLSQDQIDKRVETLVAFIKLVKDKGVVERPQQHHHHRQKCWVHAHSWNKNTISCSGLKSAHQALFSPKLSQAEPSRWFWCSLTNGACSTQTTSHRAWPSMRIMMSEACASSWIFSIRKESTWFLGSGPSMGQRTSAHRLDGAGVPGKEHHLSASPTPVLCWPGPDGLFPPWPTLKEELAGQSLSLGVFHMKLERGGSWATTTFY